MIFGFRINDKKMTIGQLFQNIPTHLAIDSKEVLTATATNLGSGGKFVTFVNGAGFSADVPFTLDDGSYVGQIKSLVMSGLPNLATSFSF